MGDKRSKDNPNRCSYQTKIPDAYPGRSSKGGAVIIKAGLLIESMMLSALHKEWWQKKRVMSHKSKAKPSNTHKEKTIKMQGLTRKMQIPVPNYRL